MEGKVKDDQHGSSGGTEKYALFLPDKRIEQLTLEEAQLYVKHLVRWLADIMSDYTEICSYAEWMREIVYMSTGKKTEIPEWCFMLIIKDDEFEKFKEFLGEK